MRGNTSYQKTDFGCEAPELLSKFVPKKTEIAGIDLKSDISANDLRTALKIDKVDNTSDKDKPIPDAVKIVLNKKISYYSISDFAMPDTYYQLPFEVGEYFILKNDGTEDISKLLYGYNESWYNPSAYYWFSNTIKAGNTALCYMKQAVVDAGDVDGHDGEILSYELNESFAQILQNQSKITVLQQHVTDREIFVMCDGDHDELKIQEALDTVGVGGMVYPVGYTIALSNSNVVTSYVSGFKSILKIPAYVNLDFRYCSNAVVFYNDAPATMQILFDLGQNSTLSNVKIDIDEDTVLSTSITPTLINTRTYCVIDNLTLCNWFGLSSTLGSVYGIYVGQYGLFRNNNITNWDCGKLGSGQSLIRFEKNTKLYDNTFDAITAEAGSGGNLFYFGLCTGSNNKFYNLSFGGSKFNVDSGYSFFSQNDFYKLSDARFSINGLWSCNMFRILTGVNDDYMFTLASNAKMDNNKFIALTQSSEEYVNCFSMSNAHFTNNQFISISISANTAFIAASSGIIANNLFNARNVSDTINIVECVNGAVVKDNCTNASSIGTYDSTCVVEGNVTGFGV